MHQRSIELMTDFRDKYLADMEGCSVLDVGSRLVNLDHQMTYRMLFDPAYKYVGMDIKPGVNVDVVGYDALEQYDVVISGQTMEHVQRPWEWLRRLANHFRHYICIIAPHTFKLHRNPLDTYRYFPDGMRDLFECAGIREVEIILDETDTVGIGVHKWD